MNSELENFISKNKEAFNTATPSSNVLSMLQQNIALEQQKKHKKIAVIRTLKFAAVACIIALIGIGIFLFSNQKNLTPSIATTTTKPVEAIPNNSIKETPASSVATNNKIAPAVVESEQKSIVKSVNYKLLAQLQNMEVTSQRYNAAMEVVNSKQLDKEIVDALFTCLNTDPNTNVRLAALESLSTFYKEPLVKNGLLRSLKKQKDPIVKMSLIDVLTKYRATNLKQTLEKIINDVNTPKPVKDQANQSMHTLSI